MMDERTKEQLENRYYPTLDEVVFGSLHRALAGKELEGATVLDAGCGKGTWILRPYKGRFRFVVGVDVYVAPDRVSFTRDRYLQEHSAPDGRLSIVARNRS